MRTLARCVLGRWPWPRLFQSLASRGSVLGKSVFGHGLGSFFVSLASRLVSSTPPLLDSRLHLNNMTTFLSFSDIGCLAMLTLL